MSMRIHKLTTHLRPEDAYTIIEFLDQVRDMLLQTYGDEIRIMMQEASQQNPRARDPHDDRDCKSSRRAPCRPALQLQED